ncbi:unnamed protein product [Auanema sp. JU1783]|nr:unnamed protein product [Auanema sp. JU1783]
MNQSSRRRVLNRSQTGPEGPEAGIVLPNRSLSASSRVNSTQSSGSITPKLIVVEPRRPRHSSAGHRAMSSLSLDEGRSTDPHVSRQFPKTVLKPVPSNDLNEEYKALTVLPFLDIAGGEIFENSKYLEKRKIKYIVNLSGININPSLLALQRDKPSEEASSTIEELIVLLDDQSSTGEIILQFRRINEKMEEARRYKDHRVLIYSDDISFSQTFVIQYMMSYYNVTLKRAICQYEHNSRTAVVISPTFYNALEIWEEKVHSRGTLEQMSSLSSSQSSSASPTHQPRRWISRRKSLLSVGRSASRESVLGNGSLSSSSSNRLTNMFRANPSQDVPEQQTTSISPMSESNRKLCNKKIAWD